MKQRDLLERLNCRVRQRYNTVVGRRRFQDWVSEDLVPGPVPGTHDWTPKSYFWALQICRLRAQGITRNSEIRIQLWIRHREICPEKLRADLKSEYDRIVKRMLEPINSTYAPRIGSQPSTRAEVAVVSKMGALAPVLAAAGFERSRSEWLSTYFIARFGSEDNQPPDLISSLLENGGALSWVLKWVPNAVPMNKVLTSGLLGDPDEIAISAIDSISKAEWKLFLGARAALRAWPRVFSNLPDLTSALAPEATPSIDRLRRVASAIAAAAQQSAWQTLILGMMIHQFHRSEDGGKAITDLATLAVPLLYEGSGLAASPNHERQDGPVSSSRK